MVHKLRPAATDPPVQAPAPACAKNVVVVPASEPSYGLPQTYLFAGIFDHLPARRDWLARIDSRALDPRSARAQAKARKRGINGKRLGASRWHSRLFYDSLQPEKLKAPDPRDCACRYAAGQASFSFARGQASMLV